MSSAWDTFICDDCGKERKNYDKVDVYTKMLPAPDKKSCNFCRYPQIKEETE